MINQIIETLKNETKNSVHWKCGGKLKFVFNQPCHKMKSEIAIQCLNCKEIEIKELTDNCFGKEGLLKIFHTLFLNFSVAPNQAAIDYMDNEIERIAQLPYKKIVGTLKEIAKELERGNKLKALEFGKDRYDGTPREIREIMEV